MTEPDLGSAMKPRERNRGGGGKGTGAGGVAEDENSFATTETASGPEILMIPTAPEPLGVATAAMVSSGSPKRLSNMWELTESSIVFT